MGFPGVVQNGIVRTAANLHDSWVGVDGDAVFTKASGCDVAVINDADAAGLAEIEFGAGKDVPGVVILLTLGTGIGSAVFTDGKLVPNTEFGHLVIDGKIAEDRASSRAKEELGLSKKKWAHELEDFLLEMEKALLACLVHHRRWDQQQFDKFSRHLDDVTTPVVSAKHRNRAGIVGAAMAVLQH